MRIRFWGVRGSIPTPLTPDEMQNRIMAIVARISASDLISDYAREQFVANLPNWLFTTVGGNTSCVEVETEDGERIIFDAGSGLRVLGLDFLKRSNYKSNKNYNLVLSHFHYDHLQGLPFFAPAYESKNNIIVYSTQKQCRTYLQDHMKPPFFPTKMFDKQGLKASFDFKFIDYDQKDIPIGNVLLNFKLVSHPGGNASYSLQETKKDGKIVKFIYSTDTELRKRDLQVTETNKAFYSNVDLFVIDSQYMLQDFIEKEGWGHSTYSMAVDFAINWQIKKILLFHHEPNYNDKTIFNIKKNAEKYRDYQGSKIPEIDLAQEGMDILL